MAYAGYPNPMAGVVKSATGGELRRCEYTGCERAFWPRFRVQTIRSDDSARINHVKLDNSVTKTANSAAIGLVGKTVDGRFRH